MNFLLCVLQDFSKPGTFYGTLWLSKTETWNVLRWRRGIWPVLTSEPLPFLFTPYNLLTFTGATTSDKSPLGKYWCITTTSPHRAGNRCPVQSNNSLVQTEWSQSWPRIGLGVQVSREHLCTEHWALGARAAWGGATKPQEGNRACKERRDPVPGVTGDTERLCLRLRPAWRVSDSLREAHVT